MVTYTYDYRHIDPRYSSKIIAGTGLAQALSGGGILASKAGMTRGAEYGEVRLAGDKNTKIQTLDGKGGGEYKNASRNCGM